MMKQLLFSFTLFLLFLFHCTTILAQAPAKAPKPSPKLSPKPAPKPAGPDITKILNGVGHFTLLIRLLKNTHVDDQINSQLKTSNQGLTVFAPTDNAFSNLQTGTLNSLTLGQQIQLLQFHVLPSLLSTSQFPTVSNPLRTQAGDTGDYDFPLNITTSGNQANVSTGVVNATVANTVYSDNRLAVYEVDKVLLPMSIFGSKPAPSPAPAPAPAKAKAKAKAKASAPAPKLTPALVPTLAPSKAPKKKSPVSVAPISDDTSGAVSLTRHGIVLSIGVAVIAAFSISV